MCAGCQDTFEIYVWSMQTGKLLDVLAGHKGPVSALAFHPSVGDGDHRCPYFGYSCRLQIILHRANFAFSLFTFPGTSALVGFVGQDCEDLGSL